MSKERPILLSAPMVRAILDGRKTQTRRAVKHPIPPNVKSIVPYSNKQGNEVFGLHLGTSERFGDITELANMHCPYGKPGDRLWVRETWCGPILDDEEFEECKRDGRERFLKSDYCVYRATDQLNAIDEESNELNWKPAIHMPRWASRILLEVVNVRVERLQDIGEEDAIAEGVEELDGHFNEAEYCAIAKKIGCCIGDSKPVYAQLWESLNGKGSWDLNPWVWVLEFRRI